MRCRNTLRGAVRALCFSFLFGAAASSAATYTADVTYEGSKLYYLVQANGSTSQSCQSATKGISYTNATVANRTFVFYTDRNCSKNVLTSISGSELFGDETSISITIKTDGSWSYTSGSSSQGGSSQQGSNNNNNSQLAAGKKVIAFFTPWSNTNAILYMNGDSVTTMTALKNYCGWFKATVTPPSSNFTVYFKQTVGLNYVGAEGMVETEPTIATEISLDSVAALSDTIWVQGYKNDVPAVFSQYPKVLGDCPLKKFPVTVFDWKAKGSGTSADFESGGCAGSNATNSSGGKYMKGMVQYNLGDNGVPVPSDPFPSDCKITEHLSSWFLPEVIATDKAGNEYTNMTCRDLYISMDDEGFWLAEVSKDQISEGNESNKGGMFLVDDFKYLDSAKTVENPYFDQLNGNGGTHNFSFTVKIQATFEYIPGQYFDFYGDDDVWVFIDNRLAVDIGGQHTQVAGAVDLDTIGQTTGKKLVPGETYNFQIFYAERHTSQSNFRMRTSIDLQVDASILITSNKSGNLTNYDVWQINKKNKLSCGYDPSNTEVDTTGGASNFRLTGTNMDSVLTPGNVYFQGLNIMSDSTFSVDSTTIVDNATLPPGHYFLEITLKSDPSQMTKIEIIVPSYAVPSISFATENWKEKLGTALTGNSATIGDWAYATYPVYITFYEDWAVVTNYNKKVNLSFDNPNVEVLDENGNKISSVILDANGQAKFYIHANAAVSGVSLIAKGTAPVASTWANLTFNEPPIPRVKSAIIVDRNGDGRADSMFVSYSKSLSGDSKLDSIQFTFGEAFATTSKYTISGSDLIVTAETMGKTCTTENCGFGSRQFTGADTIYTGKLNSWFTYTGDGKSTKFDTYNDPITDGVGPVVLKAVKTKLSDGNRELAVTMSEAITDESRDDFTNLLEFICLRSGINETPERPVQVSGSGSDLILIYGSSTEDAILPDNGDQLRFLVQGTVTQDLSGNRPHKNNPWATITGDQEMSTEAPGVIAVGEDPYGIISNPETTQPILINNTNQDAQSIGDSLGVQGILPSGVDIATIMKEQTEKEIDALDAFIEQQLGSTTTYDTIVGITESEALAEIFNDLSTGALGIDVGISEETVAAIQNGTITKDNYASSSMTKEEKQVIKELLTQSIEANTTIDSSNISTVTQADLFEMIRSGTLDKELEKAGVSASTIEAIKNGTLTEYNEDQYRSGELTLVADSSVVIHYQTRYYSQFGEYVGGDSKTIRCSDETIYGPGGCMENKGQLFLAWNMRSDSGRLVGTGVYIARLQMQVKVNGKTTLDQTRDKLMGVRRGQTTGLNLDF